MRISTFVLIIFSFVSTFGQSASDNMKELVFSNPFHSSSQSYITMLNNKNIDRNLYEYLEFESWTPIEILNYSNEVLTMDSANYFIPERKIIFYNDGQMMEIFPDQVQKVKIGDKVYAPFIEEDNKKKGVQLFEIVGGSDFKFVKTKFIKEENVNMHPMGLDKDGKTELVTRTKYYYVKEETNIAIGVPRSKSKFVRAFKRHKKKVIKYLEKRKLSLREEVDLIVIARYYNFLLNEK